MPRTREHHLHLPHFDFDHSREMKLLYAVRFLRDFINKLTVFFVPIFIFNLVQKGTLFTFLDKEPWINGILAIAAYYFVYRVATLFLTFPSSWVVKKFGHSASLAMSNVFLGAYLALLFFSEANPLLIFVAGILEGAQVNLFWPSYYTVMSKFALKKHLGGDVGVVQFVLHLVSFITPAIGGTLIVLFGFSTVFLIGLLLTTMAVAVTLSLKTVPEQDKVSFAEMMAWMKETSFDTVAISYFGKYINDATFVLWPVYMYILIGSVEGVGYLHTLSLFSAMLITYLSAVYVDHRKGRKPYYMSGILLSVLWVGRAAITNLWHIIAIDVADKLAANFHWLVYDVTFLKRGKGSQAYSFFLYREVIISAGAVFFWGMISLLCYFFAIEWNIIFYIAAAGVLLTLLIKEKREP